MALAFAADPHPEDITTPHSFGNVRIADQETNGLGFTTASVDKLSVLLASLNLRSLNNSVFLFGPWTGSTAEEPTADEFVEILQRLRGHVAATLQSAYASPNILHERSHRAVMQEDHPLGFQIRTLALQLSNVQYLRRMGVVPKAVVGYCFGEYAAAIVSGQLSERAAVDIITRRALVVEECNDCSPTEAACEDAIGAMLNVFTTSLTVRNKLSVLPFPAAELAIYAGPSHTVLSGTFSAIAEAQKAFEGAGIRCLRVDTSLPFHSRIMDKPVQLLSMILPKELDSTPPPLRSVYISGVTGRVLSGHRLGPKYWLRHMREPVRFFDCMETVRQAFLTSPNDENNSIVIDVGPGAMLQGIVDRYGWENVRTISAEQIRNPGKKRARSKKSSTGCPSAFPFPQPPTTIPELPKIPTNIPRANSQPGFAPPPVDGCQFPIPPLSATPSHLAHLQSTTDAVHGGIYTPGDQDAQPVPLNVPSSRPPANISETDFLNTLTDMFGYDAEPELLDDTFQDIGLNSVDFARLSGELQAQFGVSLPTTEYVLNKTIGQLLRDLQSQAPASSLASSDTSSSLLRTPTSPPSTLVSSDRDLSDPPASAITSAFLDVLTEAFGYDSDPELLQDSFQDIGLNSMDFVRLSNELREQIGITFPQTAYASKESIGALLKKLE